MSPALRLSPLDTDTASSAQNRDGHRVGTAPKAAAALDIPSTLWSRETEQRIRSRIKGPGGQPALLWGFSGHPLAAAKQSELDCSRGACQRAGKWSDQTHSVAKVCSQSASSSKKEIVLFT